MKSLVVNLALILGAGLLGGVSGYAGSTLARNRPLFRSPYANTELHEWACDVVFAQLGQKDKVSGCYDLCEHVAAKANTGQFHDLFNTWGPKDNKNVPLFLVSDDGYSTELVNACALVMSGAEY